MRGISLIAATADLDLRRGSESLRLFNVELVRSYLEKNLGCSRKEVCRALKLERRTVAKAIKAIGTLQ